MIYHITERERFILSLSSGVYLPVNYPSEGFIHCSTKEQVIKVANRYYKNQTDLVLLSIDTSTINPQIKYENLEGGDDLFPHIYNPLSISEISEISYLVWDGSSFSFPTQWYLVSDFYNMVK